MKKVNEYKQQLMNALDVIKDSRRCRECVGNCIECEYDKALDQIENAIETLCELIGKETPKMPIDISSEHIPEHGKCPKHESTKM